MVSRVNINNALQEPTRRCQNCNTRILQATIELLNTRQNKTYIYNLAKTFTQNNIKCVSNFPPMNLARCILSNCLL